MKINVKNLCVFAITPPYDMEGFLNKRGEVNKAFQRRYFVLKGNLLFYFEKKGDKEPLGLIIVEGCTIELSEESDQYCFEIAFNGNRTYILSADTQENMEEWMKALTCAGYEYKRLIVAELQRQLEEIEGSKNKMLTDATIMSAAPKPPPRRQNPFNRPAPPVPIVDNTVSAVNVLQMPFINGHFNVSTATRKATTTNHINEHNNNDTKITQGNNVGTTARTQPNCEFYVTHESNNNAANISAQTKSQVQIDQPRIMGTVLNDANNDMKRNIGKTNMQFEQMHEQFRAIVMNDIRAYREAKELQAKPLINL